MRCRALIIRRHNVPPLAEVDKRAFARLRCALFEGLLVSLDRYVCAVRVQVAKELVHLVLIEDAVQVRVELGEEVP